MEMMAAEVGLQQSSGFYCQQFPRVPRTSWTQNCILPGLSRGRNLLLWIAWSSYTHYTKETIVTAENFDLFFLLNLSGFLRKSSLSMSSSAQFRSCHVPSINGGTMLKRKGIHVVSSDLASPGLAVEFLDAWDDEYNGVIIDTECLPSSANAFASALLASLTNWKLKVWCLCRDRAFINHDGQRCLHIHETSYIINF